jgi:hypothetical protein
MSDTLSTGSVYSIAATYGSALTVTIATNASTCVMTSAAHGLSTGDIIEVTSGWLDLDQRIVRVGTVATNTLELEGIDTSSTTNFPAGTGIGSVRKIATWAQVAQITDATSSGGQQNYATWVYLQDGRERKKKTFKSAKALDLKINDDPTLACYTTLIAADADGLSRALRLKLPSPGAIYYNCEVAFDSEPNVAPNSALTVTATFAQVAKLKRYLTN